MKAIVAMSGGVDSSVAAFLLKKQGVDVVGLSFELWDKRDLEGSNLCCSVETIELAKSVSRKLGIEHFTVDVRDTFYRHVIESFCESYLKGTTPNPCILCNKFIKFDFLMQKAREMDADVIATGHYARIEKRQRSDPPLLSSEKGENDPSPVTRNLLLKGIDPVKDQSYVLYVMQQEELGRTSFPLGEMKKDETRSIARDLGLATALRPESQEICFGGNDRYADFIKDFSPESLHPGPILDTAGKVIGEHQGIAFYTLGQRRGLGISSAEPLYVVNIDLKLNTLLVGSREDALSKRFHVRELNWISIERLREPLRAHVKIRSTMKEVPATISPSAGDRVLVELEDPQWAPAPGQSAVFYDGDIVVGGGIIE
jgi:tRNA-specific 2-thiouridylase